MKLRRQQKDYILERDNYQCVVCGSSKNLTIDHIVPIAAGGTNDYSNLVTMCERHNNLKGCTRRYTAKIAKHFESLENTWKTYGHHEPRVKAQKPRKKKRGKKFKF